MQVLAERADSKDKIIEIGGEVYEESYTDLQGEPTNKPSRARILDLERLMKVDWLDPETAENLYKKYLKPKPSVRGFSVRR